MLIQDLLRSSEVSHTLFSGVSWYARSKASQTILASSKLLWETASLSLAEPTCLQEPCTDHSLFWYRSQQKTHVLIKSQTCAVEATPSKIWGWVYYISPLKKEKLLHIATWMSGLANRFLVRVSSFINLNPTHTHKQLQHCEAIPYYITLSTAADLGSMLVPKKRGRGGKKTP